MLGDAAMSHVLSWGRDPTDPVAPGLNDAVKQKRWEARGAEEVAFHATRHRRMQRGSRSGNAPRPLVSRREAARRVRVKQEAAG